MSKANPVSYSLIRLPRHHSSCSPRRRRRSRLQLCRSVPWRLGHGSGHGLWESPVRRQHPSEPHPAATASASRSTAVRTLTPCAYTPFISLNGECSPIAPTTASAFAARSMPRPVNAPLRRSPRQRESSGAVPTLTGPEISACRQPRRLRRRAPLAIDPTSVCQLGPARPSATTTSVPDHASVCPHDDAPDTCATIASSQRPQSARLCFPALWSHSRAPAQWRDRCSRGNSSTRSAPGRHPLPSCIEGHRVTRMRCAVPERRSSPGGSTGRPHAGEPWDRPRPRSAP